MPAATWIDATTGFIAPRILYDGEGRVVYRIYYAPDCEDHLRALSARDRSILLDAVDEQLAHQPAVETRNRKPMRPNPVAPWELRGGELRVCYDVSDSPEPGVLIRAIGIKEYNVVRIGGEEITS
jgi:mRNA-degrading endonuclease RelE of RelBE toxin-antitoxin system